MEDREIYRLSTAHIPRHNFSFPPRLKDVTVPLELNRIELLSRG